MIKVTHLKKTYIDKNKVKSRGLEDVSFSLPNKGFVFVLGKSGSGKSTLLNALTDAGVLAENKLFATLDITSRSIELHDGRSVLLTDTVGLSMGIIGTLIALSKVFDGVTDFFFGSSSAVHNSCNAATAYNKDSVAKCR